MKVGTARHRRYPIHMKVSELIYPYSHGWIHDEWFALLNGLQHHSKHAMVLTVHFGLRRVMHVLRSHCQSETGMTGTGNTSKRSDPVIIGPTGFAPRRGLPVLMDLYRLTDC